jgi:hypothetical protein
MVTVVEGVIMRLPTVLLPVQNTPPRLAYCKVKVLLPAPPLKEFQTTPTSRTVTESWGLVIVILMVLPDILIGPGMMLSHPGTAVGVVVGVNVSVGVGVTVGVLEGVNVGVIVGVSVEVLLGRGVNVITGPDGSVAAGVSDGTVAITVGVSDGMGVDGTVAVGVFDEPDPGTELRPVVISTIPSIVRALDAVIVREPIGIRFTIGLYVAITVTRTRSGSGPEFTTTPVSTLPEQVSNDPVPGPWS